LPAGRDIPPTARQWGIRCRLAESSTALNHDIRLAEIRPITRQAAAAVITLFEPMPAVVTHCFGLFFGPVLAGAVCFGPDYVANLRPQPESIALKRGVLLPHAPRNSASKLIRGSMRQLPSEYRTVTAYVDCTHGERGVVLKAAGFTIGPSYSGRRVLVYHRGKFISERMARHRFGTSSALRLAAMGLRVETVPRRTRYTAARTNGRTRAHRSSSPRPKRP
jgi:hypothetical protein